MLTLNIPVKPIVKKYFEKHYPTGYQLSFRTGFDIGITAMFQKNFNTGFNTSANTGCTEVLQIKVKDSTAFQYGYKHITPCTIFAFNKYVEDVIHRDFKRDIRTLRVNKEIFKQKNPKNFYKHVNKEIFKFTEVIKCTLSEHGLSDEEVNIHSLKKVAVRTKNIF